MLPSPAEVLDLNRKIAVFVGILNECRDHLPFPFWEVQEFVRVSMSDDVVEVQKLDQLAGLN